MNKLVRSRVLIKSTSTAIIELVRDHELGNWDKDKYKYTRNQILLVKVSVSLVFLIQTLFVQQKRA